MSAPIFVALPGGASHVATIAGGALELDEHFDVIGWSGVSAGFLVALLAAFGKLDHAPALMETMLVGNRVLDFNGIDGDLGLCAWHVIPMLVDEVLGKDAQLGEALVPLVGVVTSADTGEPVYLSKRETPRVLCSEAARATSAIVPLAHMVPITSLGTDLSPDVRLFFDGGFTDNLPDQVFDAHPEPTVSLALRGSADVVRVHKGDPMGQAAAIVRAVTFAQCQRKSARRFTDGRAVNLDAVGSGLDFDLSPEETRARVAHGRASVRAARHAQGW